LLFDKSLLHNRDPSWPEILINYKLATTGHNIYFEHLQNAKEDDSEPIGPLLVSWNLAATRLWWWPTKIWFWLKTDLESTGSVKYMNACVTLWKGWTTSFSVSKSSEKIKYSASAFFLFCCK
jgi:hypothetical protein